MLSFQVTKKQRRKDDAAERTDSSNNCETDATGLSPSYIPREGASRSQKADGLVQDSGLGSETPGVPNTPGRHKKNSAGGSGGKAAMAKDRTLSGSGNKRRSRIAANFNSSN